MKSTSSADALSIGAVTRLLGISADTLRYYEKIGLLPPVERRASGLRRYREQDLARLRFIRRAQGMNFTLAEIAALLRFREDPTGARREVRELTGQKLAEVEARLEELAYLRKELRLLLTLCAASEQGCPVIEGMEQDERDTGSGSGAARVPHGIRRRRARRG